MPARRARLCARLLPRAPSGGAAISLAELMQATLTDGAVVGRGVSTKLPLGVEIGAHVCDVEVDTDTGLVTVLRYTAFQDVGLALHPAYVEGQMQGGVVQGIGWALNEGYDYGPDGRLRNASFLDYRMPTALDVPMIDCVIVETPVPERALRRARRRRGADRAARRRRRQRHRARHRRAPHAHADDAGAGAACAAGRRPLRLEPSADAFAAVIPEFREAKYPEPSGGACGPGSRLGAHPRRPG